MNTGNIVKKLLISIAALLLFGTGIVAVTQRVWTAARVPICVKNNGQLRMLTGDDAACGPSEQQMDWVVGGEVTDIRVGQGLVGGREEGVVNLGLDPAVLEACGNCNGGRVFAGFDDGPRDMPSLDIFGGGQPAQIAKLDLPSGKYAIFVKMAVDNLSQGASSKFVSCRLEAGNDFDEVTVDLDSGPSGPVEDRGVSRLSLTMQVVHHFNDPGSTVVKCGDNAVVPGQPGVQYEDVKIIAIKASDISNVFVGN